MTQSLPIRIFLALYLALWSPLWCCCTAQDALLEVSQGSGRNGIAGQVESQSTPAMVRSCCLGAPGQSSTNPCSSSEDGESPDPSNHDQEDCECGNHFVDIASHTVTSLVMPWQLGVDAIQPLPALNLELQCGINDIDLRLIQTDDRCPGNCARTLYALHALLLV